MESNMPCGKRASGAAAWILIVVSVGCGGGAMRPRAARAPAAGQAGSSAAPLLWREAEALRLRERALEVELFVLDEVARNGGDEAKLAPRRELLAAQAASWHREAVSRYEALVDDPALRGAKERPGALLQLARSLQRGSHAREAMKRYLELLGDAATPAPARAEAHGALCDLAFSVEELDLALAHCAAVDREGAPADRVRALYVKSWALRGVVDRARSGGSGQTAMQEAMEALRDIARLAGEPGVDAQVVASAERELVEMYAHHGERAQAAAFFAKAGPQVGARLLAALHARYDRGSSPALSL
jgi:hypothetical protein